MKRETHNLILAVFLFLFLIFVVVTNNKFNHLLDVNDELRGLITTWKNNYNELQSKYEELLVENEKLKVLVDEGTIIPEYEFTEDEIYLLTQCVEAEAGFYDNYEISQRYITQVILNRLHSSKFPNSIEEIIYQKLNGVPQFSVAYDGAIEREVEPETLINAYSTIVNGTELPEYVCYFYADFVEDNWVNTLNVYCKVGGTVFAYTDEDKEDYLKNERH